MNTPSRRGVLGIVAAAAAAAVADRFLPKPDPKPYDFQSIAKAAGLPINPATGLHDWTRTTRIYPVADFSMVSQNAWGHDFERHH